MQQVVVNSEQQVVDLVNWASASASTLSVRGNNSKTGFGHDVTADCTVSTAELGGIREYHPEELVMTALAGTPLGEIEETLAEHNQYLAFEPARLETLYAADTGATIGGVFMANLAGPARFKNGSARDHLLGIRAVNGRGELFKSGGKVIKNVSGYDMSKLLAGSWGTLSIVTELSFKVLPAPPECSCIVVRGVSNKEAQSLFQLITASPCEVSGLAYVPAGLAHLNRLHDACLLIRLQGTAVSVQARVEEIGRALLHGYDHETVSGEEATDIWELVRDVELLQDTGRTPMILRLSIPPASMVDITDVIDQIGGCLWFADAAGGWIWVGVCSASAQDKIASIRKEVDCFGGAAVIYRASETIKRNLGIYAFSDPVLQKLNRRIKDSFDPMNLFNPGRLTST